jgi:hypothetical protein
LCHNASISSRFLEVYFENSFCQQIFVNHTVVFRS